MEPLRWSAQRPGERLLRVWLGATFTYAGLQKLTDPGFLTEGSSSYIGTQLTGFAQNSPIGGLLELLADVPTLAGVGVALTEIVIGLATLAGVFPAIAAAAGAGLSLTLWLAATWSVYPYFLGSDTIYAVAWLAYLLLLPSTVAALVAVRERRRPAIVPAATDAGTDPRRRSVLRGGAVVAGALALGGAAALVGRARRSDPPAASGAGAEVTDLATLRADGAVDFSDPVVGSAVVVALPDGGAAAFSRRCPHSGCTANYDTGSGLIVCPCHGSRFDPADGGAVLQGPANRALTEVPVEVDTSSGVVRRA